jgi:Heterokaryon incompatibility protein (HET)
MANIQQRASVDSNCSFCRLVLHVLEGAHVLPDTEVWLSSSPSWSECIVESEYDAPDGIRHYSNETDLHSRADRDAETTRSDAQQFLLKTLGTGGQRRRVLGRIQYLADDERSRLSRQFFGRRVNPTVDWDLVQSWLGECRKYHGKSCRGPSSKDSTLPRDMRLINVNTRRIVFAEPESRYIALSYVWGQMSRPMVKLTKRMVRENSGSDESIPLPDNLPKTIEDAIYVTKELGYDCLWNDALCIVQDDNRDLEAQTNSMDIIFSRARLTIVASSGSNADAGLPGTTHQRTIRQYSQIVRNLPLAQVFPSLNDVLHPLSNKYPWNQRAWTLQEKIMSTKILFFTDEQVYFRCGNAAFREDIATEPGALSKSIKRIPDPFIWPMYRTPSAPRQLAAALRPLAEMYLSQSKSKRAAQKQVSSYFAQVEHLSEARVVDVYASSLEEYTARTLTFPADRVRGVAGILSTLEPRLGRFRAGMPIDMLGRGLLWRAARHAIAYRTRQDTQFPSWAWAGWQFREGSGSFGSFKNSRIKSMAYSSSNSDVLIWGADAAFVCSTDFGRYGSRVIRPAPWGVWYVSADERLRVSVAGERRDAVVEERPVSSGAGVGEQLSLPHLLFDTSTLPLRIGWPVYKRSRASTRTITAADTTDLFTLVDGKGRCIGEVWTTKRVADETRNQPRTFMTVSTGDWFDRVSVDPYYQSCYLTHDEVRKLEKQRRYAGTYTDFQEKRTKDKNKKDKKDKEDNDYSVTWDTVNVMLIEKNGSTWTRVAIGKITISAWLEAQRERRRIVLT